MRFAKRRLTASALRLTCRFFFAGLVLLSCSLPPHIPVVADESLDRLVRTEAARIIAVTEDAESLPSYRIFLSDFPRQDILGMSIGQRRIYISYKLARLASARSRHLWLLRQTLAHEIAHEISGHASRHEMTFNNSTPGRGISSGDIGLPWPVKFRSYSADTELQADLVGMQYWAKLDWDCRIWVRILEDFQKQNYSGGLYHPTDKRLEQASRVCLTEPAKVPLQARLTRTIQ
jgi:predicted Zn-dependent protease